MTNQPDELTRAAFQLQNTLPDIIALVPNWDTADGYRWDVVRLFDNECNSYDDCVIASGRTALEAVAIAEDVLK